MKIFVAAEESGAIKEVVFDEGVDTSIKDSEQPVFRVFAAQGRQKYIEKLELITKKDGSKFLAAARKGGVIEVYPYELTEESVPVFSYSTEDSKDAVWVCLKQYDEKTVVVATEAGKLTFLDIETITKEADGSNTYEAPSVEVKGPLATVALDKKLYPGKFAVGGKERELEVFEWSVKGKKAAATSFWAARNVRASEIQLRVPVWIEAILLQKAAKGMRIITATRLGQIRVYDTEHGKRPKWDFQASTDPLRTLAPYIDDSQVVSSDAHANTFKFDFATNERIVTKNVNNNQNKEKNRKADATLNKFPGSLGAVLQLVTTENGLLATAGLDRYLRVFEQESTNCIAKMFIGTQVRAIVFADTDRTKAKVKIAEEVHEAEDERLWDDLKKVEKIGKKRKAGDADSTAKKAKKD